MPTRAHHARRALRWLAAVVVVALLVVCFLLTTGPGLRLLLAVGVPLYERRIAGGVAIERAEGPLLGRFTLRGVVLSDRAGRPLVVADAVVVDWSPSALLRGEVRVDELRLDGARVHLRGDAAGGFGDLAPPGRDEPEDMSLQPGPDLPLALAVDLRLRGGAVYGADDAPLVDAAELDARARGASRAATLEVTHGQARIAGTHPLRGLRLRARWASPLAAVDDLRVRLPGVELVVPSARLDVRRLGGAVRLRAVASLAGLAALLPPGTLDALRPLGERVRLDAVVEGVPEDMSGELRLALAPGAALTLTGAGAWRGAPRADLRLDAEVDLGPWTGGRIGRVRPALELHARALPGDRLALVGGLGCAACDGLGAVSAEFDGVADGPRRGLSLETSLSLAGVSALVELRALGGELHALRWRLSAPDLARPAGVARRFTPGVPAVAGSLAGRGLCAGPELRCAGALELRRLTAADVSIGAARADIHVRKNMSEGTLAIGARDLRRAGQIVERAELELAIAAAGKGPVAPFLPTGLPPLHADLRAAAVVRGGDRGHLDLSVTTGREVRAELRALELAHHSARIRLAGPAHLVLRARSVEVDHLRLDLGRGRLALRGVADLDGASDLRLDVDHFPLAALAPLMPDLRPAGLASAAVRLRGRPTAPVLRADLAVRGAGLHRRRIGDVDLAVHLAGGHARADLDLRGPLARRLALRADLPLRIDMSSSTWSFGHEPARVELRIADLRLPRLAPWVTDTSLGGRVDGTLVLTGDLHRGPRLAGDWRGRALAVERVPLGDLDVTLRHRDGRLRTHLELQRSGGRARLDGQVPLELDLARGRFAWHRARDHHAELVVECVDLGAQLATVAPDAEVDGRIAARLELSGPATAPEIAAGIRVEGLRHRRLSFGSYDLGAVVRAGGTSLALAGDGPVGRVRLQALAPIGLTVAGPVWRRDGWYALDLDLRGFELAALQPLAGVAVGGQVSGHIALAGPRAGPRLQGSVWADHLASDGAALGDLRAELGLRDGTATVAARGRLGRSELRLDARAPVDVDLGAPKLAWGSEHVGSLHLDLTDVDRAALAPFYALPPDALVDLDVHAHVDLDRERVGARASVTGAIGRERLGTEPLALRLDVDDRRQTLRGHLGEHGEDDRWLDVTVDAGASMPAVRRGEIDILATPIRGAVTASALDLRHLGGLLPTSLHDLAGELFADLELRGRLGAPVVDGAVRLRDGAVTVVPLQQRFRDITADIVADGPRLHLARLTAASGEGRVRASGEVTFAPGGRVAAEADVHLRRFPVVRPGWPQVTVDTRVQASVEARPDALALSFTVPGAEVWVSDLTTRAPDPIPENASVEILAGPIPGLLPASEQERPDADAEEQDVLQDMSVGVALTEPVHIQGPAMDMRWTGKVTTRTFHGRTRVLGEFRSDRGRFELLGTDFRIDRGRVFLPEGGETIDPYIDLAADARTPQADVTVTLRGRLSRPELRLRSQPSLTEPQIFSLLLTGTVDSNETDPKKAQASAAGLLVNFTNPTLARFADQRLGIDRIKFGFGADVTQPVLTVGKYLSKSIYAETTYHHNAPPRQNRIEGQVEYRFAPGWSVETFFGDAAVGGLDVFWRRSFGGRRRPSPWPTEGLFGHVH